MIRALFAALACLLFLGHLAASASASSAAAAAERCRAAAETVTVDAISDGDVAVSKAEPQDDASPCHDCKSTPRSAALGQFEDDALFARPPATIAARFDPRILVPPPQ